MENSVQIRIVKYDLVRGIRYNLYKYLLLFGFVFACCCIFATQIKSNNSINEIKLETGLMDYLLNMFKGTEIFNLASVLKFPIQSIGLQIIIACIVGYYPFDDIHGYL
jgi:hypothetical protein